MKFNEIVSRLTGISCPIFGLSWNPPEPERKVARRTIAFLENRRVLFSPYDWEMPDHCVQSVIDIRHFLTNEIQAFDCDQPIARTLRAMRAACRKFLDDDPSHGARRGYGPRPRLENALGELRGAFGIHIATLATEYGLDVEDELAVILPSADEEPANVLPPSAPKAPPKRQRRR